MSIIGIDFGNESCFVTGAKAGFIEALTNEYSLRATPTCVAFDEKKRIIGVAAKNQQVTNMRNTISGIKHLLGRPFNDAEVQRELSFTPITAQPTSDGSFGIVVNYLGKETLFSAVQLAAMILSKLKEIAVNSLQTQVCDCVLACPVFFTNAERRALLDAAHIAGLNVLRLMNETTATALHYGFYKTDLSDEQPRNVIFVDCGHTSLQASACAFLKGRFKVIASAWDKIGGRDIDNAMAQHFAMEFQERYKINVKSNPRAYLRLLTEVEKLKKQMSANNTRLPLSIECFIDDIDVQSSMQRGQMEQLCANFFKRVEAVFRRLLHDSNWSLADIHAVEIVGGSTRVPAIKLLIEHVFGQPASTTLNQDESVSSGATLQCAMISPQMRVRREFGVIDILNYAVQVRWPAEGTAIAGGELMVFPQNHAVPFSRMLTLCRREPFTLTVEYAQEVPYPTPIIGKWFIKNVKASERGEAQDIRVKVRVNHNGLVLITGACLVEKKELTNEEMLANAAGAAAAGAEEQQRSAANSGEIGESQQQREQSEKKKNSPNLIELPVEVLIGYGYKSEELQALTQRELEMIAIDAREKERADARNALEEYVYDMREKFGDGGALERYFLHDEREAFCAHLQELAAWLYAEGENCERDAYVEKLEGLKGKTKSVNERARDFEVKECAFEELKQCLMKAREIVQGGSGKYKQLADGEKQRIADAWNKTQKWYETSLGNFMQSPRTTTCPLKLDEILQHTQALAKHVEDLLKELEPKSAMDQQQSVDILPEIKIQSNESMDTKMGEDGEMSTSIEDLGLD